MSIRPTKKQLLALAIYGYGITHPEMSYVEISRLFGVKRGEPGKRLSEIRFRYNLPCYRYKGFNATKRRRHNAMLATEAQRQFDALVEQLGIADRLPSPQGVYVAPAASTVTVTSEDKPVPAASATVKTLPELLREHEAAVQDVDQLKADLEGASALVHSIERQIVDRLAKIRSSLTTVA